MPARNEAPAILLRTAGLPMQDLAPFGAPETLAGLEAVFAAEHALSERALQLSETLYRLAGPGGTFREPERHRRRNALLALRRNAYNHRPLDPAMLEQAGPALNTELRRDLDRLEADRAALETLRGNMRDAFQAEQLAERRALVQAAARKTFQEGVWLAGRSLFQALVDLERRDPRRWRSQEAHVASKIMAYLIRAATKTSPNSLFATTSLVNREEQLAVEGEAAISRAVTRLNLYEARKVAVTLAADPLLRSQVRPRSNPTLRRGEAGWAWWKAPSFRDADDDDVLLEARLQPELESILEICDGIRTWSGVVADAVASLGLAASDIETALERMSANGLVIAEIEIPYNEPRPLRALAETGRRCPVPPDWLDRVEALEHAVDAIPAVGAPERIAAMAAIEADLESLPHIRPLEENEGFRVDAASGFRTTLPAAVVDEVAETAESYIRLFGGLYPLPRRSRFAVRFLKRFPPGTEVPLLDLYHDVFEPEPQRRPGSFPDPGDVGSSEGTAVFQRFVHTLGSRADQGSREVILRPEDLADFCPSPAGKRWMCGALFQLAVPPRAAIQDPEVRIVLNGLFHGAGLALSRFHDLLEPGLGETGRIAATIRQGWHSLLPEDALPAEITYMHWGRTANAGLRPRVLDRELELPGDRATPGADVVALKDLVVLYDTARERFRLRSVSRDVEVLPFLSSGVHPEGFVDFLVHLGTQDLMPAAHFPGFDRPGERIHWPRFTLGRVVLFRERWVFGPEDGPVSFARGGTREPGSPWFEALQRWRREHGIPRRVFVASDREAKPFHLDLESPLCADILRRFLSGNDEGPPRLVVTEMFPGPEDLWLRDASGGYASEFLVQLSGPGRITPDEGDSR